MGANNQDNHNIKGGRSGYDRRVFDDPAYKGLERRTLKERRKGLRKRKYQRFSTKDLTFVKLRSESEIDIGQLIDISKGGLALRYFVNTDKLRDYYDMGIFLSGGGFRIDRIPFKTVSNIELTNKPPFSKIMLRRYGVQFEKLTSDQQDKLIFFLDHHTTGNA